MPRGRGVRADQEAGAAAREALERRWFHQLEEAPDLASLVVARSASREPFHRWMAYRQGFAPELVRRFLADPQLSAGPILDPFSGSGTTATEAALQHRVAVGIDAVGSLAFLSRCRGLPVPPWPELAQVQGTGQDRNDFLAAWDAARHDAHRAAVLLGAARRVDGEGHARRDAPPPLPSIATALQMMLEDAGAAPPPNRAWFGCGDARRLPFPDRTFAGVLTSPPYLSRYDYAKVNDPAERIWNPAGKRAARQKQVSAARTTARTAPLDSAHPAMGEAAAELRRDGRDREAQAVLGYSRDMEAVAREIARVLTPDGVGWIVVAGADIKRVYVPADLVVADQLEAAGLNIRGIRVARTLRSSGRHLGRLRDVAPREVVIRVTPDR